MNNSVNASIYGGKYEKTYRYIKEKAPNRTCSAIANQVPQKSRVLEFGPASGYMTRYLNEELKCAVHIAEIDPTAAQKAKQYACDSYIGDIETYQWENQWKDCQFDVIIFADVLEHLRDPWKMLTVCKNYLSQDGVIIASVPNICHDSIVAELWNNRFNYQDTGLLDKTHLRFFCEETAKDLFLSTGYKIAKLDRMKIKRTEFDKAGKKIPFILKLAMMFRKSGKVYQFVIKTTPGT